MRNHFSSHRKNKHRKFFLRSPTKKETEIFLQKPKKITFLLHKEFDIKKHGDNDEQKKRKFNLGREQMERG